MIAPVGVYQQRVWKSIIRSGAQQIHLLTAKVGPYKDITSSFARTLEADARRYLMLRAPRAVERHEVDFSDVRDIYRTYAKIIEDERKQDEKTEIVLDVTSTPMEGVFASTLLAQLYDATLSYVPPKAKLSEKVVEKRIAELAAEQTDEGEEPLTVEVGKWRGLDSNEFRALKHIYQTNSKGYGSIAEFTKSIAKEDQKSPSDAAFKRNWNRVVHALAEKELIQMVRNTNGSSSFSLTAAGEGIFQGQLGHIRGTGQALASK
jgi:hypothetical protein